MDRERDVTITDLVDVTVGGCDAYAEIGRIGLTEFRNVIGDGAAVIPGDLHMTAFQKPRQRRLDTAHANIRPSGQICPRVHPLPPPVRENASPVPMRVSELPQLHAHKGIIFSAVFREDIARHSCYGVVMWHS